MKLFLLQYRYEYICEYPRYTRAGYTLAHGDFATSVALALAKQAGKNPRQLGEDIAVKLREQKIQYVDTIEVAGPGFINFTLVPAFFTESLREISERSGSGIALGNAYAGREVVVEYTDPNPFKAFHIGHLMSNAIGESLARLIESQGAKVYRAN
jgi:arginyl-tRNA synthetase